MDKDIRKLLFDLGFSLEELEAIEAIAPKERMSFIDGEYIDLKNNEFVNEFIKENKIHPTEHENYEEQDCINPLPSKGELKDWVKCLFVYGLTIQLEHGAWKGEQMNFVKENQKICLDFGILENEIDDFLGLEDM